MNKKITVHIISHTHWDREWYLNSKYVNEWLPPFFDSLFAMMEKQPAYKFVLDGQMSMLDDCYVELQKSGRDVAAFRNSIKKYARDGRLVLGPYYLQPDWQLCSEEALVRNLSIGSRMASELGGGTTTGWMLDNFGQIAQTSQIHQQFGMRGIVVWRGVEMPPNDLHSEFQWRSPDGTVLPCIYLLSSYRNAMRLGDYPAIIHERIKNEAEKIVDFATTPNVLLMNGYDQEMEPDDILPYIQDGEADFANYTVRQSTPDELLSSILEDAGELQELSGTLYSGRYISVFPGILSARMYLKQQNHAAQRWLAQYAEPLAVMAAQAGYPYPSEQLEKTWKLLLKNHAHDSICGVGIDDVHTDMEDRYQQVMQDTFTIAKTAASQVVECADAICHANAAKVYTVFNTLPSPQTRLVYFPQAGLAQDGCGNPLECQPVHGGVLAAVDLPAMGYRIVGVYPDTTAHKSELTDDLEAQNKYIHLRINTNGTVCITQKDTGEKYDQLGYLEESADTGDEYNYSYLTGETPRTTLEKEARVECIQRGGLRTVFRITHLWKLPSALSADRKRRSNETVELPVEMLVTLEKESPVVKFSATLRNRCRDHRVRVCFPTSLETDRSLAQTQFDITPHPIVPESFDNDEIPYKVQRIVIGARESAPITQFPQGEFVALQDGKKGVAVFNQGLPEYEVLPENTTIALTLFRSIGWMTRFDLNTRIGDAGPEIMVSDAQCLRDMTFDFAFCPYAGDLVDAGVMELSHRYQVEPLVMENAAKLGTLPDCHSFLSINSEQGMRLTACKEAENRDGIVLRLYNAAGERKTATISLANSILEAATTDLSEKNGTVVPFVENKISISAYPKQIVTVFCKTEKDIAKAPTAIHEFVSSPKHNVHFEDYPLTPVITQEAVRTEEERAKSAEAEYTAKKAAWESFGADSAEEELPLADQKTAATLRMQAEAAHRAALEARLSAILAQKKLHEFGLGRKTEEFARIEDSFTETIRAIAYELNVTRINKRVSEYIVDYYTQKCLEANAEDSL